MQSVSFEQALRQIVADDPRYPYDAYAFVQDALQFTQRTLGRHRAEQKHVAGRELLEGIREYSLKSFGPMAATVLAEWGIQSCEDFGEIVFNMIEHNLATKTDTDSRDDFKNGYSFDDAFRKPFLPSRAHSPKRAPQGAKV